MTKSIDQKLVVGRNPGKPVSPSLARKVLGRSAIAMMVTLPLASFGMLATTSVPAYAQAAGGCRTAEDDAQIKTLQDLINSLDAEIASLQGQLPQAEADVEAIKAQIRAMDEQSTVSPPPPDLGAQYSQLHGQLADAQQKVANINSDISKDQVKKANAQAEIDALLAKKPCPPNTFRPGVDQVHYGPNGNTFEHHTDGSTVILGPDGNTIGFLPPPLQLPPSEPPKPKYDPRFNVPLGEEPPQKPQVEKPEIGRTDTPPAKPVSTPERREQAIIEGFKTATPPKKTTPVETKPTTFTQPKTTTRTEPKTVTRTEPQVTPHAHPQTVTRPNTVAHVQPHTTVRPNAVPHVTAHSLPAHFANPGPVARVAPQAAPMHANAFRPTFSPAARGGGFGMARFGRASRDTAPAQTPPAADAPEQKPAEEVK